MMYSDEEKPGSNQSGEPLFILRFLEKIIDEKLALSSHSANKQI